MVRPRRDVAAKAIRTGHGQVNEVAKTAIRIPEEIVIAPSRQCHANGDGAADGADGWAGVGWPQPARAMASTRTIPERPTFRPSLRFRLRHLLDADGGTGRSLRLLEPFAQGR
jgi:hypothetical protein